MHACVPSSSPKGILLPNPYLLDTKSTIIFSLSTKIAPLTASSNTQHSPVAVAIAIPIFARWLSAKMSVAIMFVGLVMRSTWSCGTNHLLVRLSSADRRGETLDLLAVSLQSTEHRFLPSVSVCPSQLNNKGKSSNKPKYFIHFGCLLLILKNFFRDLTFKPSQKKIIFYPVKM